MTHSARWHPAHREASKDPLYEGRFRFFSGANRSTFFLIADYIEQIRCAKVWFIILAIGRGRHCGGATKGIPLVTEFLRDWSHDPGCSRAMQKRRRLRSMRGFNRFVIECRFGDNEWVHTGEVLRLESILPGRPQQAPSATSFHLLVAQIAGGI